MENKFRFKCGDIVFVNWLGFVKCRVIERQYEFKESEQGPTPIENVCYKLRLTEGYDREKHNLPEWLGEDRIFKDEKEAANDMLKSLGFSLRF